MRNRFDQLAKQIGQEALTLSGFTVAQDAINPETQYADLRHEPDPRRQAERDRLGLLGRLAAFACIIEVYSEAPNAEEFRACLTKHLAAWQQRARKARSANKNRDWKPSSRSAGSRSSRARGCAGFAALVTTGLPSDRVTRSSGSQPAGFGGHGDRGR
jgi:hypothetical protein